MGLFDRAGKDDATEAARRKRLPPGQILTEKWPVLTYGETPRVVPESWRLSVSGLVERPFEIGWDDLTALPVRRIVCDLHCVTRWSRLDSEFEGARVSDLLEKAGVHPDARYMMVHAHGGYTTNLPLAALTADDALLAYRFEGEPLAAEHGGPCRLLVPRLYLWKSAKWVKGLELMREDRPGFWERAGYHMNGDPWKEERHGWIS